jgi:hypothetical protein
MAPLKLRNLAKYGIIYDVDPFDLPPEAFSAGKNVRFRNGRVTRGPVFRSARALSTSAPRYVFANNPTTGQDDLYVCYQNGRVFSTSHAGELDVSISGYTNASSEGVWTDAALADVVYINREDRIPWFKRTSDSAFQPLTNWDSTWRAKLLRTCGGSLVALNVTKAGISFPTMVKTSSFPLASTVPASWDHTLPNTNATENILAELKGPIVDAQNFGSNLIIYGREQPYLMQKVNGFELYDYTKLPFRKGAIAANCSIEIDGRHYVFGPDDIWMHDATSEASIVDGTNRDFIFSSLNVSKAHLCFVTYNPNQKELHFCYPGGDRLVSFLVGGGCNKQAVYNLTTKTWTFDDLPLCYGAAAANMDAVATYNSIGTTYQDMGGSYQDQEGSLTRTLCYVGESSSLYGLQTSLYAFDLYGPGSTAGFAVDTNATQGMYLERDGIDLHALDPNADLGGYTLVSSIWPLARNDYTYEPPITFSFGSSDYYGQAATNFVDQTYDGYTNFKLDYNIAGRYMSLRVSFNDYNFISVSGFDLEVDETSER